LTEQVSQLFLITLWYVIFQTHANIARSN